MENSLETQKPQLYSLLFLVLFVVGGLFVGQFFALVTLSVRYGFDIEKVVRILEVSSQDDEGRVVMLINLGVVSFFTFFIAPLAYLRSIERKSWTVMNSQPKIFAGGLLLAFLITIVVMPFNALLIEWNMHLNLPEALSGFERWASAKEAELKVMTEFLTKFQDIPQFLLGILVIAIVPALGEEVLFRGVLQRNLSHYISPHIAIFITAFTFSAVHFQFYGLIPRMLLGVLFGYLYYWSGNIWTAIFAHFINNGFTLTMVFLFHQQQLKYNIEETTQVPLSAALTSLFMTMALLILFKYLYWQHHKKESTTAEVVL